LTFLSGGKKGAGSWSQVRVKKHVSLTVQVVKCLLIQLAISIESSFVIYDLIMANHQGLLASIDGCLRPWMFEEQAGRQRNSESKGFLEGFLNQETPKQGNHLDLATACSQC